jgi:hypothetical protein
MRIRTLTTALTAAAMLCTSATSFAQAAPEPAASVESGAALSHEGVEHENDRRTTMWAVLGFVVIVVTALLVFSDDEDGPVSA